MASRSMRKRKHVKVDSADDLLDKDWVEEETNHEDSDGEELSVEPNNARKPPLNPTRNASTRKPSMMRCLFYVVVSLAALYFLIGVWLMYGSPKEEADVLGAAVPIGEGLTGNVAKIADTDIGASLVFVAVPLLGIVAVLFMLLEVIGTSMDMKAKVPIVSWMTVSLFLGVALLFTEVRVAAIQDKAYSAFSSLVTVLAALTYLHRKDD